MNCAIICTTFRFRKLNVWVTFLSLFMFPDEHLKFFRVIGIAFVVGGVSILGMKVLAGRQIRASLRSRFAFAKGRTCCKKRSAMA